jgi:glutaredoxin
MLKNPWFLLLFLPNILFSDLCDLKLDLYYNPSCPYCIKVLKVIEKLDAPITLRDVSQNKEDLKSLIEVGGKMQVPCLFIDGKPMYESGDIINWLQKESKTSSLS